jgi:CheY-like chemotaxis protein
MPQRRILVVEDELAVGLHLQGILRKLGFTVLGPVGRLDQAVRVAQTEPIDAALLDINLSRGDLSYPAARVLAERGIPFAFVTACYRSAALDEEFAGHAVIAKPFVSSDVEGCVRELLAAA